MKVTRERERERERESTRSSRVHGRAYAHVVGPAVLRSRWYSKLVRQVGSFGEFLSCEYPRLSRLDRAKLSRASRSFSRSEELAHVGGALDLCMHGLHVGDLHAWLVSL
jgi:hypothetical protein